MSRPKSLKRSQIAQLIEDRLNLSFKELGAKYNISKSSAWNYFQKYCKNSNIQEGLDEQENYKKAVQAILEKLDFSPSLLFQDEYQYPQEKQQEKRRHTQNFTAV